jgi:hypothetical protein
MIGIKVSKRGFDATTAGVGDLQLDTSYPLLKIKASGSGTLSISDGGSDSDTIVHNLGYAPKAFVFGQTYSVNGGIKITNFTRYPALDAMASGTLYADFEFEVNSTQLIIKGAFFDESGNSETFDYFYYIYYDEK